MPSAGQVGICRPGQLTAGAVLGTTPSSCRRLGEPADAVPVENTRHLHVRGSAAPAYGDPNPQTNVVGSPRKEAERQSEIPRRSSSYASRTFDILG